MANRWYVKQNGRELGPFSDAGLRRFLESDQAGKGALFRNGSAGPWLPASQLGAAQAAQGGAAPAVAAAASASAPVGRAADDAKPIEAPSNAGGQKAIWSRPAALLAAGMGASVLVSVACIGIWLLAQRLIAPRQISAAPPPPSAAPPSQAVADLENETKRLQKNSPSYRTVSVTAINHRPTTNPRRPPTRPPTTKRRRSVSSESKSCECKFARRSQRSTRTWQAKSSRNTCRWLTAKNTAAR